MGVTLSEVAREITRSNFIGKDFDTYRQEIIEAQRDIFGPEIASNIVASEQGVLLIERQAFSLSTLSWYLDRQADETNLDIPGGARVRANAVAIARVLGYTPHGAVPPIVEIQMVIDAPFDTGGGGLPSRLTLEKGRSLTSETGVPFELAEETIFEAGEAGPKTLLARQGRSFAHVFQSTGERNQRFFLTNVPSDEAVAEGTISVRVSGILWQTVDLMTFDQTDIVELNLGADPPFIRFGDGLAGNIPPENAEIRVEGFSTRGPNGTVTSNTVTEFDESLIAGTTPVSATLTHDEPSTPGSFAESLNSIKTNAPLVFQAAQRAVTIKDLDGFINSFVDPTFGAVAKGRATTPRSAAGDAQLQTHIAQLQASGVDQGVIDTITQYWNKVVSSECRANIIMAQILASDPVGRYVSAPVGLARALEAFLDERVESTAKVWVVDGSVSVIALDVECELTVDPRRDTPVQSASIREQVNQIIQDFLLDRDYGVSFRVGDLYELVEAVDGVQTSNIRVTNQPSRVDAFGNVLIGEFEVITMGQFPTVTTI